MNWNQALFPSLKGGVDARSRKCREATLVRVDGVARSARPIGRSLKKRSAKSLGLKSFAELTTPSAALRRLRAFYVSALKQSVNSFTRSEPWVSKRPDGPTAQQRQNTFDRSMIPPTRITLEFRLP